MTVLAAIAWIPAAIWAHLLAFRGMFWLPTVRLPDSPTAPEAWPTVAVVVPARNEAEMLSDTLPALLAQDYPGKAAVFLVDDRSDDGTAETTAHGTLPLEVVHGVDRPAGWVGKTWALQQGLEAAYSRLAPELVLFTDADIHHPPDSLSRLVAFSLADRRDLVSLMARLRTATAWERLIVPAFVYFFSQLYPFRSVASGSSRTAAAAGGCMLVRTAALARAGGLPAIAGELIDDVALGRAVKRSGGSVWLGYAGEVESIRPYPRLADLWDMVARSAYTQLRHSRWALVGTLVALAAVYVGPVAVLSAGLASGDALVAVAGGVAEALLTISYVPMVSYYRVGLVRALTLPVAALIYAAMTLDSARRHRRGAGSAWKGRTYGAGGPSPVGLRRPS